jgi:hypothetical protein
MKNLKDQLLDELKRDKKKAAVMAVLLAVAIVLFARLLLKKPSPAQVTAAPVPAARSETPPVASAKPLSPSSEDVPADTSRDEYLRQLDTSIKRDIFAPPESYFPPGQSGKRSYRPITGGKTDVEKESVWNEAKALTLESTVLSVTPRAMIDGQLVRVGDWFRGFRVEEIRSRSVTLGKDGISVSIEMKGEQPKTKGEQ